MAMMGGLMGAVMSILPMMMMMGMMKSPPPPAPPPPPPPAPPEDPKDPEGEMDAEVARQRLIKRQAEDESDTLLGLKNKSKLQEGSDSNKDPNKTLLSD